MTEFEAREPGVEHATQQLGGEQPAAAGRMSDDRHTSGIHDSGHRGHRIRRVQVDVVVAAGVQDAGERLPDRGRSRAR
jgi:hypothetical protein